MNNHRCPECKKFLSKSTNLCSYCGKQWIYKETSRGSKIFIEVVEGRVQVPNLGNRDMLIKICNQMGIDLNA